jgi:hypothetical protein
LRRVSADYIVGLMVGSGVGWIMAHSAVARECERLGSFYVGKKVFKCYKIEEKK